MMTREQLLDHPGHEPPVLLKDGNVGMLIGFPFDDADECRVQVYGEEEARRIHPKNLTRQGVTGMIEDGATFPDCNGPESFDTWAQMRLLSRAMQKGT